MLTVQQYVLDPGGAGTSTASIPDGARLVGVQQQGSDLCVLAVADDQQTPVTRTFVAVATDGDPVEFRDAYVGSVGGLHVFEHFPE